MVGFERCLGVAVREQDINIESYKTTNELKNVIGRMKNKKSFDID